MHAGPPIGGPGAFFDSGNFFRLGGPVSLSLT